MGRFRGGSLVKEFLEFAAVAESFRASGGSRGKCASEISVLKTSRDISATQILGQETSIEAIAGAHRIDDIHLRRCCRESLTAVDGSCTLSPEFYNHCGNLLRETGNCGFEVIAARNLLCLALVRQDDVDIGQRFCQRTGPEVLGIVVGVERCSSILCSS